ncbi:MAG: hypothetical protein KUG72_10470 [Pseudomonadales bacterium]|nr:hypothetical protein [Pseudomonadales bacterium]
MSQQLFIDCSGLPSDPLVWALKGELSTAQHAGTLADLSIEEDTEITLVFSGLDVLLLNAAMPTRNQQKIRQALPYLFEEQLLEDAELLHFAIGTLKSDQLQVAVIAKALLQQWLDALSEVQIQPDQALIDTQLLGYEQNRWVVWCDDQTALARTDLDTAFACDRDQLISLLAALPDSEADIEAEQSLHVFHQGELDLFPFSSNFADRKITAQTAPSRFQFLAEQFSQQKNALPIDLLQGEFGKKKNGGLYGKWAAVAASIALLLVVGYSSLLWYQNSRLESQYQQLQQQMTGIYKSTFPNSKRIVDPKVQMKGQLKKLQGLNAGAGGVFKYLELLAKVSAQNSKIELVQIRYQKNGMELKFETDSLQVVEQFREKMAANGIRTKVLSANKESGRVMARVKLETSS